MGTENDNCVALIRLTRDRVRAMGLQFAYPASLPHMDKGAATALILGCCDKVYTGMLQLPAPPSTKPTPFQSNLVACVFDVPEDLTTPAHLCDFPYDRVVGAYHHHKVSVGDRVAQACILPIERAEFEVVPFA